MSLPKIRFNSLEVYAFEKARGMIRMGRSDAEISDYIGMVEDQVASIRRDMPRPHGRPTDGRKDTAEPLENCRERLNYEINAYEGSRLLLQAVRRAA